jgi:hypothetical protein
MIFYLTYDRLVKTEHACRMHNIDLGEAHMRWITFFAGLGVGCSSGVLVLGAGFGLHGSRFLFC